MKRIMKTTETIKKMMKRISRAIVPPDIYFENEKLEFKSHSNSIPSKRLNVFKYSSSDDANLDISVSRDESYLYNFQILNEVDKFISYGLKIYILLVREVRSLETYFRRL